jgi:hypothetical protein
MIKKKHKNSFKAMYFRKVMIVVYYYYHYHHHYEDLGAKPDSKLQSTHMRTTIVSTVRDDAEPNSNCNPLLCFCFLDGLFMFCLTLDQSDRNLSVPQLQVACNPTTPADPKMLERIQRNFVALYQNRFFVHGHDTRISIKF